MILFLGLSMLVTFPKVQSWLVLNSRSYLSEKLGAEVKLEKVSLAFPYKGVFETVSVGDCNGEVLLRMERLRVNMISFSFWNILFKSKEPGRFKINGLDLIHPEIFISRTRADSLLNFECILANFQSKDSSEVENPGFVLDIAAVHVENGRFVFADSTATDFDSLHADRINFRHIRLDSIATDFSLLYESTGRVEMYLNQISTRENHTGLKLEHFSTFLVTGEKPDPSGKPGNLPFVELSDLSLTTGKTWIKGDVWFPNTTFRQLIDRDFNENFEITLKDSRLEMALLNYVLEEPMPLYGILEGEGRVTGNRNEIHARDFSARYMNQTRMKTDIDLYRYLDPAKASLDIRVEESRIYLPEIQTLLPTVKLPPVLKKLQLLSMTGSMTGGFYDFVINAKTATDLGAVQGNLHIQLPPVVKIFTYEGFLSTENLDFDKLSLLDQKISSRINFEGKVKGRGINLDEIDTYFDARITDSDLLGYYVDSLYGDVQVADHILAGKLIGSDGEGSINVQVDLDLSVSPAVYKIDGIVKNLNLARYKIYPDTLLVSSGLHVDLKGDSLEEINGELRLAQTVLHRPSDSSEIRVPDLLFAADKNRYDYKYINLKSSVLDADIAGDFSIKKALSLVQRLGYESSQYFANDDSLITDYYAKKLPDSTETDMRFGVAIRDSINQIFDFLRQPVFISPGAQIIGYLQFGKYDQALISLDIDSLVYQDFSAENVRSDINLVKESNKNQLNIAGGIYSDTLKIGEKLSFDEVSIDIQGKQDTLSADLTASQKLLGNDFRLKLIAGFFSGGKIEASIDPDSSRLVFRGEKLQFNDGHLFVYDQKSLDIRNLMLEDENSYLRLDGLISSDEKSTLKLYLAQLGIDVINDFFPLPYSPTGKINADVELRHILADPEFAGRFKIEEFQMDGFDYGEIFIHSDWKQSVGDLNLRASLLGETDTTLTLLGKYSLTDSVAPIDMNLITQNGFPLDYIYPFVKTQLFGIKGNVELEEFTIKGDFKNLKVNGIGHFEDAGFGVEYFQTRYSFDGKIYFDNDRITFPRITLYDPERNHADFHGVIRHRGLREFDFDLQLDQVKNFLIMNTQKKDNDLFYGTMYIKNGIADITGDLEKLTIQAIASSGPKSRLRIPITYEDDLGKPEFVHFTTDKLYEQGKIKTGLQGFELNLTAIATEDIQIDLIFDEKVGDIMQGRGEGVINLKITEDGEFTMFGDYEVKRGEYLFTAQNVFNKKFQVKPGGMIKWTGDPFGAELNIDAIYALNADIKDLIQEDRSIRVPVQVLMHLQGLLLQPEIQLSINLPNLSEQGISQIASYLKNIEYDEQELNKQVFSLMVFNRFAPTGGLLAESGASTGVTTSVSELLSNQLNYWLSQVMSDKVSVNVNTTNFQDVNLLVSAKLFKDRVTLERDGTLVGSDSNFALGNISLIIKLLPKMSEDGLASTKSTELVLEVFNRESLDLRQQNNTNKAGIGIFFKKDFDKLSELMK
ncbi:MAG: translocation/assembly module TamB domain-containing protein [Bacteroidia bacterium]|nr:translocation/assembly module TamB domain-containing protein [Bacteroidia bacterium]